MDDNTTAKTELRRSRHEAAFFRFRRSMTVLLLGFSVVMTVLGLAARDRAFSDSENRALAQRPALSWAGMADGSFFQRYADYLSDQVWGRDGWITLDALGQRLLGRQEVNGVYIGRGGWLLSAPEAPDPDRLAEKTAAVNDFAARNPDVNVMLLLAPDAASVLADRLPRNAPVRDQWADIDGVRRGLSADVAFLDAGQALLAHRDEYIYYRTDHHWTSLGAYYVFASAADQLTPGGTVPAFTSLTVEDDFRGTLAAKTGLRRAKDEITVYLPEDPVDYYVNIPDTGTRVTSLFDSGALEQRDRYQVFLGGNHPLVEIYTTANNGRSLLVLKDSYANCFMQFLPTCYDRIILIDPRYYYGELDTALTSYGITDVLLLYSADTWMTDTTLADVLATG